MKITQTKPQSQLPIRSDFHVVSHGVYWALKRENRAFYETIRLTKAEAIGYGIEQARMGHVSLVIHGRDGKVQRVYSYDNWIGPDYDNLFRITI
jgi:hypothetical protein